MAMSSKNIYLVGEFQKHEGREDSADAGAHGTAHKAQNQLDVWHQDPDYQADQDDCCRDHVEPGGEKD